MCAKWWPFVTFAPTCRRGAVRFGPGDGCVTATKDLPVSKADTEAVSKLTRKHWWHHTHAGFNCCLCAIAQDLSRLCIDVNTVPFVPEIVKLRGDWSNGHFANNEQHDVNETIYLLLNALNAVDEHEALALRPGLFNNAHPCRYTTPMWQTFKISYTNRMTCRTCHFQSV